LAARSDPLLFDLLIAILSGLVTILLVRAVAAVLRIGRARRRHLAGVWYQTSPYFWTTDIQSNPRSCGTFHLQMVDPFLWVGRYTTAVGRAESSIVIQELKDLPLEWAREAPAAAAGGQGSP
jgi:hypothetical protein